MVFDTQLDRKNSEQLEEGRDVCPQNHLPQILTELAIERLGADSVFSEDGLKCSYSELLLKYGPTRYRQQPSKAL